MCSDETLTDWSTNCREFGCWLTCCALWEKEGASFYRFIPVTLSSLYHEGFMSPLLDTRADLSSLRSLWSLCGCSSKTPQDANIKYSSIYYLLTYYMIVFRIIHQTTCSTCKRTNWLDLFAWSLSALKDILITRKRSFFIPKQTK